MAANRDELLDRPSSPPVAWDGAQSGIFAPRDLQAGGTWLGLNAAGLFVGITNRMGARSGEPRRSRGLLVRDALRAASAAEAAETAAASLPDTYDGFHLILADRREAWLVHSDLAALRSERLSPGVHVVSERSLGAAGSDRAVAVASRLRDLCAAGVPDTAALAAILGRHPDPGEDPLFAPCVHLTGAPYGTRSSTLLWLGPDEARMAHADGPPCRTPYDDLTALLRAVHSE